MFLPLVICLLFPHTTPSAAARTNALAFDLIRYVLGKMPSDAETPPPEEKEREIQRLMLKQRNNEYQATEKSFILRCGARFAASGGYGPNPEPVQLEFQEVNT
jgi:hypothetical protein